MELGAMGVTTCKLSLEAMGDKWDMIHTAPLMACLVVAVLVDSTLQALTTVSTEMVTTVHGEGQMFEEETSHMTTTISVIICTLMSV